MNKELLEIIENMEMYGGSFVKTLALLMRKADKENLQKLVKTFDNYIREYHPDNWK
jgi:hypothetical protein